MSYPAGHRKHNERKNMRLKRIQSASIRLCFLTGILLLGAGAVSAQISIRGLGIPKPKKTDKQKTDQPATTDNGSRKDGDVGGTTRMPASDETPKNRGQEPDFRVSIFV